MSTTETENPYVITHSWRDEEQLERAYWEYYWSTYEIASWVGVAENTVHRAMDEHDVTRRDRETSNQIRAAKLDGAPIERIRRQFPHPDSGGGYVCACGEAYYKQQAHAAHSRFCEEA